MNLVTYLVGDLHLHSASSATIVTNFMGTLNLLGLLGGFLADAKLGRYLTVAISATIATVVKISGFEYFYKLLSPFFLLNLLANTFLILWNLLVLITIFRIVYEGI